MSKHTTRPPVPAIRCAHLYHAQFSGHGGRATHRHVHPFWHMDVVMRGEATVVTDLGEAVFGAGECAMIPADVAHGFLYASSYLRGLSIRFEAEGYPPCEDAWVIDRPSETTPIVDLLMEVLPADAPADGRIRQVAGHLLAAILASHLDPDPVDGEPSLQQTIERLVHERGGRFVSVEDAAEAVGYSASRLAAKLRNDGSATAKQIIDRTRASMAGERLRYSDETIGAIADALGFPDIYTFSHFFKRMCGEPPSAFRGRA